jgi:phosphoserine phosphatase
MPSKKLTETIQERNALNEKAKSQKQLRDQLNITIKEELNQAIECRDQRDEINQEVEKYKKLRDETNKKIQTIQWTLEPPLDIKKEIKKIKNTPGTVGLNINEATILQNIQKYNKELQEPPMDKEILKDGIKLRELSKLYHNKVVELSDEAQNKHNEMLEHFQKTDEIRTHVDEIHHKFVQIRENASKKHNEVRRMLKKY